LILPALFTVYTEGNKIGHSIFSAGTEGQYIKIILAVARCGLQTRIYLWSMHYGAPPNFLLTVQELFEQCVSRTTGRKRWTKNMACSFT
jgi:hypothetical protein